MANKEIGVETLTHKAAKRTNIPTAELESVLAKEDKSPIRVAFDRRNRDLDPQLVWRGKSGIRGSNVSGICLTKDDIKKHADLLKDLMKLAFDSRNG